MLFLFFWPRRNLCVLFLYLRLFPFICFSEDGLSSTLTSRLPHRHQTKRKKNETREKNSAAEEDLRDRPPSPPRTQNTNGAESREDKKKENDKKKTSFDWRQSSKTPPRRIHPHHAGRDNLPSEKPAGQRKTRPKENFDEEIE